MNPVRDHSNEAVPGHIQPGPIERTLNSDASCGAVPKLCGGDYELGNFLSGATHPEGTGYWASRAVLAEIDGVISDDVRQADVRAAQATVASVELDSSTGKPDACISGSQDWGRKFLFNGGCAYIDLNHLELCLPEVLDAWGHLAYTHAMYAIAQQAAERVNARLSGRQRIHLLANNSDRLGNSYGSHLNFLLARTTWENLFHRRLQHQLYLASYQAASILFAGQGKVGFENSVTDDGAVPFQLSQRADFLEVLAGPQTTYNRPVVNSRNEPLTGTLHSTGSANSPARHLSRLHCIFYDHTLCHVSSLLKVGVMQIILSLIEAGEVSMDLVLDDPVAAVRTWSQDLSLSAQMRLLSGRETTALDLLRRFRDQSERFISAGRCDRVVPRAHDILELWSQVLDDLSCRRMEILARRLDWALKFSVLQHTLRRCSDLSWQSPEIRHLDQLYSSLDPRDGLYWTYERRGLVDRLVNARHIERCIHEPPACTRAWTRATLLLMSGPNEVESIDWDYIRFRLSKETTHQASANRRLSVHLPNPLGHTKADLDDTLPAAGTFADALTSLGAQHEEPHPRHQPVVLLPGQSSNNRRDGGSTDLHGRASPDSPNPTD